MADGSKKGQKLEIVVDRQAVRETAAKLYGQGFARAKIARILVDHLVPNGRDRPLEQRLSQARNKLRAWERTQNFRDLVWNGAVVKLDLQAPAILDGISQKAKRGRVDAARLALEVTGRHNPKGDQAPTQVQLVVTGVPRPTVQMEARRLSRDQRTMTIEGASVMVREDEDV